IVTKNAFGPLIALEQKEAKIRQTIKKKIHQEINNPSVEAADYLEELKAGLKLRTYEEFCNFTYNQLFNQELHE
ncbi:2271_t:CDS:1, partial [Racocetra persica]